ncbi:MAG: flagellar biosynthesis protein FlhA [Phycisphaerae bacterium]|nr:flagellar biosynthesis protein FlhA [Phycisphaerae bacterium]
MATAAFDKIPVIGVLHRHRGLLLPLGATSLVLVILIPLPPALMDVLLSTNITVGAVILLTTIYVVHPLEFSSFPSLLLAMTLFRLVLNTASTRLILTAGERSGSAAEATAAAGHVIQAFGNFVAGGSLAVGLIIFIILVVIQFVVITKGATRISEVAARFTLDGMPGKQMAIDADLNAGLIDEPEARRRREAITREADFYGAMDGASKFVRGDAVAGIIITLVNILGGLYVGMVEYGWDVRQCMETFTKLTIGDGLVTQIPAFIISIAAGLIVTRSTATSSLGEDLLGQLTAKPVALAIAAGFLGMLALTPLPKLPLLMLGGSCAGLAWLLARTKKVEVARQAAAVAKAKPETRQEPVETLLNVDPMELEVGYGLIRLVDKSQGGDLLDRISMIRRQMAIELGLIIPPIRIRDNMQLDANDYAIKLRGVEIARGSAFPGQFLAIDSGAVRERIGGEPTQEPAFGLPAVWITEADRARAERNNYTVVPASSVIATHLTDVIKRHACELVTRDEARKLLDGLKEKCPAVIEEVVGPVLKLGDVQKVLQNLLRERVPIRDLQTILETLGDWGNKTKDLEILTEYVRNALARTICAQVQDRDNTVNCLTLDPALEDTVNAHVERTDAGSYLTLPPSQTNAIVAAVREEVDKHSAVQQMILLCSPQIRLHLRRLIESALPNTPVLAFNEIVRDVQLKSHGVVSMNVSAAT